MPKKAKKRPQPFVGIIIHHFDTASYLKTSSSVTEQSFTFILSRVLSTINNGDKSSREQERGAGRLNIGFWLQFRDKQGNSFWERKSGAGEINARKRGKTAAGGE